MKTYPRKSRVPRTLGLVVFTALICAALGLTPGTSFEQTTPEDWKVDPIRGPVDFGLTDPSLIGAIDVHLHVDPDAPGTGGVIRAIDVFDAADRNGARHARIRVQDPSGHGLGGHRLHGTQAHHRPSRFSAAWRRTTPPAGSTSRRWNTSRRSRADGGGSSKCRRAIRSPRRLVRAAWSRRLARTRPWMLMMPEGTPPYVAVSKNGELLPEVKHLISDNGQDQDDRQ